jgi:hypothetical protein
MSAGVWEGLRLIGRRRGVIAKRNMGKERTVCKRTTAAIGTMKKTWMINLQGEPYFLL